ncbi:SDR family NAD(P)-dependent oxidoreductase [Saccharothrix sp. Mg75]|uniref:SDR family NAD(P)-dependent oxidoreductase n=1 Tax=Saccharothrix sp. Mg75 TaxID=3445357 RepID=UPI003EE8392A
MDPFKGITAVVTGASKGLGEAYAMELARRGADLVLVARSADALERVATAARRHGGAVDVVPADLADPEGPATLVAELAARGHRVDLLLNNAGAGSVGPFFTRPLDPNLDSVRLNVIGLVALTGLIGRDMLDRGSGGIVNVASTAAFQPFPYQAGYAATKAFVLSFTEAVAEETRGTGLRVMVAHPGATATGFFDGTTAVMDPRVTDSPAYVAARTLDDFARGRTASYPGRPLNRAATWTARFLPRRTTTRLAAALSRRLGLHDVRDAHAA